MMGLGGTEGKGGEQPSWLQASSSPPPTASASSKHASPKNSPKALASSSSSKGLGAKKPPPPPPPPPAIPEAQVPPPRTYDDDEEAAPSQTSWANPQAAAVPQTGSGPGGFGRVADNQPAAESWLNPATAAAGSAPRFPSQPVQVVVVNQPKPARAPQDDSELEVPARFGFVRVISILLSGLIMTVAVLTLLSIPSLTNVVLAIYLMMFAVLICCFEARLLPFVAKKIASNFGFLYNWKVKPIFLMGLGVVCFGFTPKVLGWITAISLFVFAFFQCYFLHRHSAIQKQIRKRDLGGDAEP